MAVANLSRLPMALVRHLIYGRLTDSSEPVSTIENTQVRLEMNDLNISDMQDMEILLEYLKQEPSATSFFPAGRLDCLYSSGILKFVELTDSQWFFEHIDNQVFAKIKQEASKDTIYVATLSFTKKVVHLSIFKGVDEGEKPDMIHIYFTEEVPVLFEGIFEFNITWYAGNSMMITSLNHENFFV